MSDFTIKNLFAMIYSDAVVIFLLVIFLCIDFCLILLHPQRK